MVNREKVMDGVNRSCKANQDYEPDQDDYIQEALLDKNFGWAYERIQGLAMDDLRNRDKNDPKIDQLFGKLELDFNGDCDKNNDIEVIRDRDQHVVSVLAQAPGKDALGRPTAAPVEVELYDREDSRRNAARLNSTQDKGSFWTFSSRKDSDSLFRQQFRQQNPGYDSALEDSDFRKRHQVMNGITFDTKPPLMITNE